MIKYSEFEYEEGAVLRKLFDECIYEITQEVVKHVIRKLQKERKMKLDTLLEEAKIAIIQEERTFAVELIKERLREISTAEKVLHQLKLHFSKLLEKDIADVV